MATTGAKTKDLKFQKIQTAISKTSAGLISNDNELMKLGESKEKFISKKEMKTVIEKNVKATLEAMTILAGANSFTNEVRRDFMTATFSTSMRNCCQFLEVEHDSENLFGKNFTKKLSEWKTSMCSMEKPTWKA